MFSLIAPLHRSTAATGANADSSRSHAIMQVALKRSRDRSKDLGKSSFFFVVLSLFAYRVIVVAFFKATTTSITISIRKVLFHRLGWQ